MTLYIPWRSANQIICWKLGSFLDLKRSVLKALWMKAIREANTAHSSDLTLVLYVARLPQKDSKHFCKLCTTADCFQERKYNFEMMWFTAQPHLMWNKAVSPVYIYIRDMKEKVKIFLFPWIAGKGFSGNENGNINTFFDELIYYTSKQQRYVGYVVQYPTFAY